VFSDAVWAVVEPVLPADKGRPGQRWSERRRVLAEIARRCRVGAPWRPLPPDNKLTKVLVSVDSTSVGAHQLAAPIRKGGPAGGLTGGGTASHEFAV
jgi:transposase